MSIRTKEDAGLKSPVRFKVLEQPPLVYSSWRRPGGHFWAAPEAVDFLDRLVQAWMREARVATALAMHEAAHAAARIAGAAGAAAGMAAGMAASRFAVPRIFLGDIGKRGGGTWPDHKSHAEGTQIDIYYITLDRTNTRIYPKGGGRADAEWNFDTEMNALLLKTILACRPYRVLTQVPSMLTHPDFAGNPRIENKPPHWDHFHVDVVRQSYQKGYHLPDQPG